jgi:hypothetical protein
MRPSMFPRTTKAKPMMHLSGQAASPSWPTGSVDNTIVNSRKLRSRSPYPRLLTIPYKGDYGPEIQDHGPEAPTC